MDAEKNKIGRSGAVSAPDGYASGGRAADKACAGAAGCAGNGAPAICGERTVPDAGAAEALGRAAGMLPPPERGGICYIFGAGDPQTPDRLPAAGDAVIAADGGWRLCAGLGIAPDLTVGDFDSLGREPDAGRRLRLPVEKDDTDTMFALKAALARGWRQIRIFGGTGGRLDHTLANLQALLYAARRGARALLFDGDFVYTALDGAGAASITVSGPAGATFSVFCLSGTARGVTERGGKYGLEDSELTSDVPVGVSNSFTGSPVEISLESGGLIVGWQYGGDTLDTVK